MSGLPEPGPGNNQGDELKERRRRGRREGAIRRDAELFRLRVVHHPIIVRLERAFVKALLEKVHPLPADYVYELVPLPAGWNPKLMGAVFRGLDVARVIRCVGHTKSARPERHGGDVRSWELVSTEAATAWLAAHPEPPGDAPGPIAGGDPLRCPVPAGPAIAGDGPGPVELASPRVLPPGEPHPSQGAGASSPSPLACGPGGNGQGNLFAAGCETLDGWQLSGGVPGNKNRRGQAGG